MILIALAWWIFGALYGFTFDTYDGADLGSPEVSTERTTGGKFEGLFLGA